ncbi:unnamed protein product [Arabis nemorensis]|uniref:Uncharacterized protein n=1 Tax=Arabis nemorensis TaxID=586526 RepID=A0A565B6F6_9BRAS|nr:unnamed protein product [Arabis nemorensis]
MKKTGMAAFKEINYVKERKNPPAETVGAEGSARTRPAPSMPKNKKLSAAEKALGKRYGSATTAGVTKERNSAALVSPAMDPSRKGGRS